ncbi:MAG TPA: crosslink repair DNA glycosylase YcaQ family protein [Bacillales bacterium]|nr:crosslink repair DNA glycosylase YcaQ family protein [Bacillales bacterium]
MDSSVSIDPLSVRRFLLYHQSLLPGKETVRPISSQEAALSMIRRLECVQLDPVSVVERNQHLVLAVRISGYKPVHLDRLLTEGLLFEYIANAACTVPIEDYPIFKPIRERIQKQLAAPLKKSHQVVHQVLNRLKKEGPLPSRAFKSENKVRGYWDNETANTKETSYALNLLLDAGLIRVVRRDGTERYFDLPEKTIPKKIRDQAKTIDSMDARRALIEKYMRAYRVFDARDPRFGWQKMTASDRRGEIGRLLKEGKIVPLQMEGVKQQYYIRTEDVDKLQEIERETRKDEPLLEEPIKFLAPLDNLLWRRDRLLDLFGFHYRWEIYTPKAKRRYGAYAMPILCGDRLIGRMDPQLDRKNARLVVRLLQIEPDVSRTPALCKKIREGLASFAEFHNAGDFIIEKTEPSGIKV